MYQERNRKNERKGRRREKKTVPNFRERTAPRGPDFRDLLPPNLDDMLFQQLDGPFASIRAEDGEEPVFDQTVDFPPPAPRLIARVGAGVAEFAVGGPEHREGPRFGDLALDHVLEGRDGPAGLPDALGIGLSAFGLQVAGHFPRLVHHFRPRERTGGVQGMLVFDGEDNAFVRVEEVGIGDDDVFDPRIDIPQGCRPGEHLV